MKDCAVVLASFLTACLAVFSEISEMEVQLGGRVSLPCNSSAYGRGELDVQWEALGKDVAFFQDGQLVSGSGYEGRLELQISQALEGDFSLTLNHAVMSDSDMYECLWQGKRSISTVMLKVLQSTWMEEAFNVTEMTSLSSSTETTELTTSTNGNATTAQDTATVTSEMLPQSNTTIDFTWFIDDASEGGTTIQDTTEEILPEPSPTADVFGFIVDNSADSTTIQDTEGVISQIHPQPSPTAHLIGFIADNSADSTTVEDTVEETIPHPSRTKDFAGLVADSRDDINGGQDLLEGEGESFELVLDEKVPWVRIGIISGVLLVTAALMGTLLALGKL